MGLVAVVFERGSAVTPFGWGWGMVVSLVLRLLRVDTRLRATDFSLTAKHFRQAFSIFVFFAFVAGFSGPVLATDAPPAMIVPGQFNVSATGAATYTIPIAVPPGTAGMVPALSLDYSSQSGDGIVGLGWTLSGLPSIGRCARTYAQDNVHGSVNYDANDRFCMEGQRLVAISGTYGADSTVYRTEIDGFSKIVSYGTAGNGPSYFKVWTKSGQIMEFGNTTDSKILAVGSSTARSWAVDKISDTKGNYLTVTYTNDTTNGQTYPSRIDYTGNASAGLSPYNSVQFSYNTSRPDVTPTYQAGSLQQTTVLLTDVKTYQGSNLVYDYQLAYRLGSSTTHSRLTSVTLCDTNGSCLSPTTFAWQGGTGTLAMTAQANGLFQSSNGTVGIVPGYFKGDGILGAMPWNDQSTNNCGVWAGSGDGVTFTQLSDPTFAYYSADDTVPPKWENTGSSLCDAIHAPQTLNFSSSGLTDIAVESINITNVFDRTTGQWRTTGIPGELFLQNVGNGSFTGGSTFNMPTQTTPWLSNRFGDFNGDGRTDVFFNDTSAYVELSNGDGTWTASSSYSGNGTLAQAVVPPDFDGDGCSDVLYLNIHQINFFCNPTVSTLTVPSGWGSTYAITLGDFNGDGKTDVLQTGGGGNAILFLSTGTGFVQYDLGPSTANWSNYTITTGDFNGDGKTDILLVAGATTGNPHQIWLSTGTGFVQATDANGAAVTIPNTGGSTDSGAIQAVVADWNNDGASDIWLEKPSGDTEYLFSYVPELMTSVSNGIGATTTITYDRLNKNGSLYQKCSNGTYFCGDAYPTQSIDGAFYVVSRVDASNGIGGTYSSTYSYAGAKTDLHGRGFLGFSSMTVNDLQTGVVQTTNYRTDFPFVGLISSQTKTSGSVTLNSTSNTFADSSEGTGTDGVPYNFVSLSQSVVTSNDLDGTAMPTSTTAYTYDSYGNAATVNVSLSDGSSKNTTNTYTNDTTNWFLGRLTNTSVTSTVPDTGTGGTSGVQPPVANNDSVTTNENTPVTFDPRSNDSDPSGYALTIIATSMPGHGTVAINNGTSLTYTPASMYSGSDSFTYTISDGQGHAATATVSVTVTYVAPPTGSFSASASPIAPGSSSILSWTSSGATTASINSGIGSVTPVSGGSVTVTPGATTTYTLTLTGLGGTITKQVTVTVVPTPTGTFSASPATIGAGSSSTLTWTSANATSASINNGVGSVTPVAGGSVTVTPTVTTTYTLTLTGPTGTITQQATVTVIGTPSGTLSSSPATINLGGTSTLTWSATNTTSSSINNGVGTVSPASGGSVTVSPTATTTYTLTMTGLGGTNTATATVTIPAPTGSITASPTSILLGGSSTLSWTSTNATSASINNGVGGVATSGSVNVSPSATTTYTLTLTGPSGTTTGQVTITVYPPPTASLSASPATVNLGSASTLSWSTANATSISINNGVGSVATSGSVNVTPAATTTYTLTATGPGGTATSQATVTIPAPSGSLSASPASITQGSSTTLSWSSSNATSASINNGVGGVATSGSVNVSPSSTTTYTLTLTGPSGTATQQVTVTVYPLPTGSLSASPTTINLGSSSTLSWSSSNVTSASINNGVGSVATSGSTNVSPSSTTTYTLTLSGPGGTITPQATVTVNQPPVAVNDEMDISATVPRGKTITPHGTINPLLNDSDPMGYALTVIGVTQPSNGTATYTGNSVSYTYKKAVSLLITTDSFTYTISDGHGNTATATVSVVIDVKSNQ